MRYLIIALLFLVVVVLQMTVIPFFSFATFRPDLIAILVVVVGLKYGKTLGMLNGFALGLMFDLFSGGIIGLSSFTKTANGFIAGYFFEEDKNQDKLPTYKLLMVILLCISIDNFFYNFISGATLSLNLFELIFTASLLPGIYSTVVALPILFFRERISI